MLGSANAAFDLWIKDMPPPLKKEEEPEEEQGSEFGDFDFVPERNPYGGGLQKGDNENDASEGTATSKKSRFSSLRAYDGHTRGQDMNPGEDDPVDLQSVSELVHIQGEVGSTVVKDHNNYLMLTCMILLLLGIGLALYAYNHRKSKFGMESMNTLRTDAYGAV